MGKTGIAEQAINLDAPYRYPEQAIREAYRVESESIVKVSSYFAQLRGGTVRLPGEVRSSDPYDIHAQSAMLLHFFEQRLSPEQMLVIRAKNTKPTTPMLEMRKRADAALLYEYIVHQHSPDVPRRYAEDAICGWIGYRRHHRESWWARHLKKDEKTLYRWRWGTKEVPKKGFLSAVYNLHLDAVSVLTIPMREAGLIRE
jgi:hypothetical protein